MEIVGMFLGLMFVELILLVVLLIVFGKKNKGQTREHEENFDKSFDGRKKPLLKRSFKGNLKKFKPSRPEQWVILGIYVLMFLTIGYFLIASFLPLGFFETGIYKISASSLGIGNSLRSLYITGDVLGANSKVEGNDARVIYSTVPFDIVFNPKKIVPANTSATLELSFLNEGTDIYLNDNLIIPDLEGYSKVESFGKNDVYVKDSLLKDSYVESKNVEDFVYNNFGGNSVYSFSELESGTPILNDYAKVDTRIDTQFRDNLKLAVYAEDSLDISFTKEDLNDYVGKDEYTVTIRDFEGNSVFSQVYEDDGDKKDSNKGGNPQKFDISLDNLKRSIYYISFEKDKNNKASDSTIRDLRINSNKVLILGRFLPLDQFEFYTEISGSEKIVGFYYWHNGKDQKIKVSGSEPKTIDLGKSWIGKRYEENLSPGGYSFKVPKGDLNIYFDAISPSKETWFSLPQTEDKKLLNSDVVIINSDNLKVDGQNVVYTKQIKVDSESKFRVQVLDDYKVYLKNVKLTLL